MKNQTEVSVSAGEFTHGVVNSIPVDEAERVAALHALHILDTEPEERFDRIVRILQAHFNMPVARVSFVDDERTWFKSCVGLDLKQAPRNVSICSYTILNDSPLVVHDLKRHTIFQNSPQVTGKPNFRFYAGAPIILDNGFRVGSVCLMDYVPHPEFSDKDKSFLEDVASLVVSELKLHRQIQASESELATAEAEVGRAQSARSRFLAIVSHELRTPLNSVSGFNGLIRDLLPDVPPNILTYMGYIDQSVEHLTRQIDRILTYSAAQMPGVELDETQFSIQPLLSRCIELVTFQNNRSVTVEDFLDGSTIGVFADQSHVMQIVTELTENAVAFTIRGGSARVETGRTSDGGLSVRFLNDGKSIPQAELDRVMNAFAQAEEGLERTHEGLGLGLPIAKALARLHGGDVDIKNRPDGGVESIFTLPPNRIIDDRGAPG